MKEIKISFAPGAFDSFTGTQEELDALVAELKNLVESGEIFQNFVWEDDTQDTLSKFTYLGNNTLH